jgi:uncharacterized DUF497 family protein
LYFEWDDEKAASNYRKHHVLFETAALVFEDPNCMTIQDRTVDGEDRWQTIGRVQGMLLLLVAHTVQGEEDDETVRIISARKVTAHERRRYESSH